VTLRGCKDGEVVEADEGVQATADVAATLVGSAEEKAARRQREGGPRSSIHGLRTRAWNAAGNRNPALTAAAADPLIIDIDATLVTSHSDKENVASTYKGEGSRQDGR
jgi:hypothetical protein